MQAWEEPISSRGSYRYIMSEDTDQFSRMINIKSKKKKNMIILPQLSPNDHHQLYSYGYGNLFFSDVPMLQTDNKNILNANEISSFSMDSNLYNQPDQPHDEALAFFPQYYINHYQYSAASAVPSMESVDQHSCPSFDLNMKTSPTLPRCDYDDINTIHKQQQQHQQQLSRDQLKLIKETVMGNFQGNNCSTRKRGRIAEEKPSEDEWKSNKKRVAAAVCCRQQQSQDYQFLKDIKEVHRAPPLRRSQKLADRITALQKLVSPYGKTDTASVLYEASIFIKVLQDQIQNIFTTLQDSKSNQHKNTTTGEGKEMDLRNKGLCLVPVWLTQKLVEGGMEEEEEDGFSQYCSLREN